MKSRIETSEIVVGLDIGTTKVSAVVGEVDADGITILGVGNVPCRGLRKGVVSNIDWTVRAIAEAIEAAQTMAGVEIRTVYAGVAGSHIRCQSSDGVAAIGGGEVTRSDVDRVLEGARAIPVAYPRALLDGIATLAQIRKRDRNLPVIMFSTLTERGATATLEALALGASDYVTKPANVEIGRAHV